MDTYSLPFSNPVVMSRVILRRSKLKGDTWEYITFCLSETSASEPAAVSFASPSPSASVHSSTSSSVSSCLPRIFSFPVCVLFYILFALSSVLLFLVFFVCFYSFGVPYICTLSSCAFHSSTSFISSFRSSSVPLLHTHVSYSRSPSDSFSTSSSRPFCILFYIRVCFFSLSVWVGFSFQLYDVVSDRFCVLLPPCPPRSRLQQRKARDKIHIQSANQCRSSEAEIDSMTHDTS